MKVFEQLNEDLKNDNICSFLSNCFENNLNHLGYLISRNSKETKSASFLSEQSKIEFSTENKSSCFDIYEEMVKKFSFLSGSELLKIYQNLNRLGLSKYDYYNPSIVRAITERTISYNTTFTFSITTCKRLNLFTSTMNSFLNCCQDLNLIDRWICVDDNSSAEDRRKMKELYPFFEFIEKNETQKGHVKSMNIIKDYVNELNSKYLFHMEDDFLFFISMPYISMCKNVLDSNDTYGQCLLNRNYAETCEQWAIHGGYDMILPNGQRYSIHEHYSDKQDSNEKKEFYRVCSENNLNSCAYWPHFSFRPSLIKVSALNKVGNFNDVSHFEMEYAHRYTELKYKSVFLYYIVCKHIGKLTHEKDKDNAYSLNNQQQFTRFDLRNNIQKYIVFNMEKRPDRLKVFKNNNDFILTNGYTVENAFDGYKLKESYAINRAFDYNNHNWRRTIMGCGLSHLKIWYELNEMKDDDIYVVFEDDIVIVSNFNDRMGELSTLLKDKSWDIVFLGYAIHKVQTRFTDEKQPLTIQQCNIKQSNQLSFGGTYGYMINGKGAKKLLALYNITGIDQGIDTMMQKSCDLLNVFYVDPHLVFTVHFAADSDIQKYKFVQNDFLLPNTLGYISVMKEHMESKKLKVNVVSYDKKLLEEYVHKDFDVTIVYNASDKLPTSPAVTFYFMHDKCAVLFTNKSHDLVKFYKNRLPLKFSDF